MKSDLATRTGPPVYAPVQALLELMHLRKIWRGIRAIKMTVVVTMMMTIMSHFLQRARLAQKCSMRQNLQL